MVVRAVGRAAEPASVLRGPLDGRPGAQVVADAVLQEGCQEARLQQRRTRGGAPHRYRAHPLSGHAASGLAEGHQGLRGGLQPQGRRCRWRHPVRCGLRPHRSQYVCAAAHQVRPDVSERLRAAADLLEVGLHPRGRLLRSRRCSGCAPDRGPGCGSTEGQLRYLQRRHLARLELAERAAAERDGGSFLQRDASQDAGQCQEVPLRPGALQDAGRDHCLELRRAPRDVRIGVAVAMGHELRAQSRNHRRQLPGAQATGPASEPGSAQARIGRRHGARRGGGQPALDQGGLSPLRRVGACQAAGGPAVCRAHR